MEAAKRDPETAMAFWGVAYVLGPIINASMDPANSQRAYEAAQKALRLGANASPMAQDLIHALSRRYASRAMPDRSSLDRAYADAMAEVYRKYPNQPDIAVL